MRSTSVDLIYIVRVCGKKGGFDVFKESMGTTRLAVMTTVVG